MWRSARLLSAILSPAAKPNPSVAGALSPLSRAFSVIRTSPLLFTVPRSPIIRLKGYSFGSSCSFVVVRCLSSKASHSNILEWNEPVSYSEVGDGDKEFTEDAKPAIPVRAYFFSTRFGLVSLLLRFMSILSTIERVSSRRNIRLRTDLN